MRRFKILHLETLALRTSSMMADQIMYDNLVSPGREDIHRIDSAIEALNRRGVYKNVALIDCEDLEEVFVETQNGMTPWIRQQSVTPFLGADQARSTSVGDIVVDLNTNTWYLVASAGFIQGGVYQR